MKTILFDIIANFVNSLPSLKRFSTKARIKTHTEIDVEVYNNYQSTYFVRAVQLKLFGLIWWTITAYSFYFRNNSKIQLKINRDMKKMHNNRTAELNARKKHYKSEKLK